VVENKELKETTTTTEKMEVEEKTPKPKECLICGTVDNLDKLLSCDGCESKYHIYCITPRLKKVPHGSWSCKKCVVLNSKACSVCLSTEDDEKMLLCDGCDEGFHLHCLDPPLVKVPKDEHWFCKICKMSDSEVIACKLLLGHKELHLETRRLIQSVCEDFCKRHNRNLTHNANAKKVLKQLKRGSYGTNKYTKTTFGHCKHFLANMEG